VPKLPNADLAHIEPAKLQRYLLDSNHEDGGPKARFLERIGFDLRDVEAVEKALLLHGRSHVATELVTRYGLKYHVDGSLVSPTGRAVAVWTVWQVDSGTRAPRFVTMKPLRRTSS
jgi:hypothetical protein